MSPQTETKASVGFQAICRSCGMSKCIGRGAFRLRGKQPRKRGSK